MKTLHDCIYETHTEYCGGSGIDFNLEQVESKIIDETIQKLATPTIAELGLPLEDYRNDEKETADDILKNTVEFWIGDKCLDALAESGELGESYLESLSVCVTLSDDWQAWINY